MKDKFVYYGILTPANTELAKSMMEENGDMDRDDLKAKLGQIGSHINFGTFESKLLFEKAYQWGYTAAHMERAKGDDGELSRQV